MYLKLNLSDTGENRNPIWSQILRILGIWKILGMIIYLNLLC